MNKASRQEVFDALDSERAYQASRARAVGDNYEHQHSLEQWIIYMENYLHELKHSLSRTWRPGGTPITSELDTMRKVTALGVAAMEQHGAPRREGF